jgi:hypothetical protein
MAKRRRFSDAGLFVELGQTVVAFGINRSDEHEVYFNLATDHSIVDLGMTINEAKQLHRKFGRAIEIMISLKRYNRSLNQKANRNGHQTRIQNSQRRKVSRM